jgi:hypothetical protein
MRLCGSVSMAGRKVGACVVCIGIILRVVLFMGLVFTHKI